MMLPLKAKLKTHDFELELEGSREDVTQAMDDFVRSVRATQKVLRLPYPTTLPDVQPMTDEELQAHLDAIMKDAKPVELRAGTMDVDRLIAAIDAIREGLSQEELDAIADAMNYEYIEPVDQ